MRSLSLFSGAGGMDRGFEDAGFRTVLACERDRDAAASHALNFPAALRAGDIMELLPNLHRGAADAVFGGPPCQGFSVAGRMDPCDPRSGLVFAFVEAVERVRPLCFVMENVDALARLPKFRDVLAALRARAAAAGYATYVEILDASEFGVPQRRRRMFMWGSRVLGPEALGDAVRRALAPSRQEAAASAAVFAALGPAGSERNPAGASAIVTFARRPVLRRSPYAGMLFNGAGRPVDPARPAPTMAASAGGNKTHIVDEAHVFGGLDPFVEGYLARLEAGLPPMEGRAPDRLRRLTVAESRAFQTFPESFRFAGSSSSVYRQVGNAVPCLLARAAARGAVAAAGTQADLAA